MAACQFAAAINGDPFLSRHSTAHSFPKINRSKGLFPAHLKKMDGIQAKCEFEFRVKTEDGLGWEYKPGVVRARNYSSNDCPWKMYVLPADLQSTTQAGAVCRLCKRCTQAHQRPIYHKRSVPEITRITRLRRRAGRLAGRQACRKAGRQAGRQAGR
jgi:hypothetical protein